jgi:hypothetical protein
LHMVDRLGETLVEVMGWAEGCPCHSSDPRLRGPARHRANGLQARIGKASCPLDTRRAPECASGEIVKILQRLLNISNTSVLMDPLTLACMPEDRGKVIGDFAAARRQLVMAFSCKLAHWQQLPYVLFGVAHHDLELARSAARRALQLFHHAGDVAQHHWVTMVLCAQGSTCRLQLQAFADGASLAELPILEKMVARFAFVPIAERWIESRHAILKQTLRNCPHASAQHVAFFGIMPSLRKFLKERPQDFLKLVRNLSTETNHHFNIFNVQLSTAPRSNMKWHHPTLPLPPPLPRPRPTHASKPFLIAQFA